MEHYTLLYSYLPSSFLQPWMATPCSLTQNRTEIESETLDSRRDKGVWLTTRRTRVQTPRSTVYRQESSSNALILTCSLMTSIKNKKQKHCQAPTKEKARAEVLSEYLSLSLSRSTGTLTHWHIVLSSSLKACLLGHFLSFLLHFC